MAFAPFRRTLLGATLLLIGGGCAGDAFTPPEYCTEECPLPKTKPPVVTWLFPAPGASVTYSTDLVVNATDDRRVDHVEFFWEGIKLHPGVIGAAPWHALLGKYRTEWPQAPSPVTLTAIATDIEGYSDTAYITVNWIGPDTPP